MTSKILNIESRTAGTRHRLALQGELDLTSAQQLTSTVFELCANGARELVLDVAELVFIDSTGLRAILNSKALCEERLCDFAMSPARDQIGEPVRRLFEITDLLERLPFRDAEAP